MKFGRLVFGPEPLRLDERRFLDESVGGGSEAATLEDEARSWVEMSNQTEDEFIDIHGDEYEWHQGFSAGIASVMCTLAEICKGIEIPQERVVHLPAPPAPEIDLLPPVDDIVHLELEWFVQPSSEELRAAIAKTGLSKRALARKLGVNNRAVSAWSTGSNRHRSISQASWHAMLELARDVPEQPVAGATEPPPPPPPVPTSARSFSPSEQDAIDAALNEGRFRRIEQGEWPEAHRSELRKWGRW